jgi:hypothetical protein
VKGGVYVYKGPNPVVDSVFGAFRKDGKLYFHCSWNNADKVDYGSVNRDIMYSIAVQQVLSFYEARIQVFCWDVWVLIVAVRGRE